MLTKRSVVSVILLTIITCGIYGVWWTWVTCKAMQEEGKITRIPPVLTTLLVLFYSNVGCALLGLDADENLNAIKEARGIPKTDNKVLWIVLGAIIPIVTMALVQYEINMMIDNAEKEIPRV